MYCERCQESHDPELHYDRYQFQKTGKQYMESLSSVIDYSDGSRCHLDDKPLYKKNRIIPDWAKDLKGLQRKLKNKFLIVYLYYYKQLSTKEIAEEMGTTAKAIQRSLDRIRKRGKFGAL